jgi:hypothetical protein
VGYACCPLFHAQKEEEMFIQTETGSVYEIGKNRMRTVSANHAPTRNQGDGGWQPFISISPVEVGQPLLIMWRVDNEPGKMIFRQTATTRVVAKALTKSQLALAAACIPAPRDAIVSLAGQVPAP